MAGKGETYKYMKYQLIQHLKTKSKVLTMYDTLADCLDFAKQEAVTFVGRSSIGNFPIFNGNNKVYSIQGYNLGMVCSLPKGEAEQFN